MNHVRIYLSDEENLEYQRQEKLKQYRLDDESIKEFRNKIKKAHENKSNWLGELLVQAMGASDYNRVNQLLLKGANMYVCTSDTYYSETHGNPLNYCVKHKKMGIFILLIRAGCVISEDVILECVRCNREKNLEIFDLLGIDLKNFKDAYGSTLIDIARMVNNKKVLNYLEGNTSQEQKNVVIKPVTNEEILRNGMQKLEEALKETSKYLGENYQKILKK